MIKLTETRRKRIKSFIKEKPYLVKLYRLRQNKAFFKKRLSVLIKGKNNVINKSSSVLCIGCRIDIIGSNNAIICDDLCLLNKVTFFIRGNNNIIHLKRDVNFFRGGELWIEDNNCRIDVGENTTFEDVHLAVTEDNSRLAIGEDCMFAYGIDIRTGDSHSILNESTLERINSPADVVIGNHVWVAAHCSILKGVKIAKNSVVATRSVVTKKYEESNILIGGVPAKKLKGAITWDRRRL